MLKKKIKILLAVMVLILVVLCSCSKDESEQDSYSDIKESSTELDEENIGENEEKVIVEEDIKEENITEEDIIGEEIINPLLNREYDTFNEDIDYSKFHDEFLNEYLNYLETFSNYMEIHRVELNRGERFCDFSDYETSFLDMYTWAFRVINYDINNVPEEYREYWTALSGFALYNIDMADKMYRQSSEERSQTIDSFVNYVDGAIDTIESFLPTAEIMVGQTIIEEEYEATLLNVEFSYDVEPEVKPILYTHYPAENGKVYIHIDMDIKNLQQQDMRCDNIYSVRVDYNNGYTYSGFEIVEDSDGDFTYSSISKITPLETRGVHALVSCPEEVATSSNPLIIYITFYDGTEYMYRIR